MLFMHNATPPPKKITVLLFHLSYLTHAWGIITMLFHALFSSNEFDVTPPCYIMHAFSYEPQNP
jgi:hypothetical protein